MSKLLSICIPTYNRSQFLPETLQSIFSQHIDDIEVVVCDNGSEDQTIEVMKQMQITYPQILYFRFEKNVGPDRCFLKSVEIASGEYCWLLGDDDILEPGSIALVLTKIRMFPELSGLTVNRYAYDSKLQLRWIEPPIVKTQKDLLFKEANSCLSSLFLLFGFLSAQVVKRAKWLEVGNSEDITPYFTAYVLVYIIGRMIQKDPFWLYVHTPCVGWRSGNDSFAKELGRYKRFELDVIGYHKIITGLCKADLLLQKKLMNQVCRVHLCSHMKEIRLHYDVKGLVSMSWRVCFPRLKNISSFWYMLLPAIVAPCQMLGLLRQVYRLLFKKKTSSIG